MKKIIFFLAGAISIVLPYTVKAESAQFYEGEYINNIWMNRVDKGTIYYQKARTYKQKGTEKYAYCIEPFTTFKESSQYTSTIQPSNLTKEQKERIALIVHFGYNYKSHTDMKWYAISQMMIWKTAAPSNDFYFTDSLNGKRINIYQDEMNYIEILMKEYKTEPSFSNATYNIVAGEELSLWDANGVINNYTTKNKNATIEKNKLILKNLPVGEHEIIVTRKEVAHRTPLVFYQAENTQNLVTLGDIEEKNVKIKVSVKETEVNINKLDKDTKTTKSSGEAILSGAKYQILDKDRNELQIIDIDETNHQVIKNLPYGKYYIREVKAGTGYTLDDKIYEFEITKDNPRITLNLYNEVVKTKLIINKRYLINETLQAEKNIIFGIYDKDKNLITKITTNQDGIAEITLPYGNYTIIQLTTTEGYDTIEPFNIIVENETELTYNLVNRKIQVPNTSSKELPFLLKIINIILLAFAYV